VGLDIITGLVKLFGYSSGRGSLHVRFG